MQSLPEGGTACDIDSFFKPHNGIHGTAVPETIGYASSHGCVRLTNWDAVFLAEQIRPGVRVRFVD